MSNLTNKLTPNYGGPLHYLGNRFLSLPNIAGHMFPDSSWLKDLFSIIMLNTPHKKVSRCFEPFAGSASWSLAAMELNFADEYVINDSDDILIRAHQLIRDQPEEIKNSYSTLYYKYQESSSKEEYFLDIISKYNNSKDPFYKALVLPFIINHSWSGILMHDSDKNLICPQKDDDSLVHEPLMVASLSLEIFLKEVDRVSFLFNTNNVTFKKGDFQSVIAEAKEGDFVALNPPYPENVNARTNNAGMYVELYSSDILYRNLENTINRFEIEKVGYYMTYGFYNPQFRNCVLSDDKNSFRHFFRVLGYEDCAYGIALDQMYFSTWFLIPKNLQSSVIPANSILENEILTLEQAMNKFVKISESFLS